MVGLQCRFQMSNNQNPTSSWAKPFAAAWRARAYFIIGFAFWLLANTLPHPFAEKPNPDWWQTLIQKGVGSFDKISAAVLFTGLVYAVLSDVFDYLWANSLQAEVRQASAGITSAVTGGLTAFTSGLVGMSFEAVKVWVEGGTGGRDQVRAIGLTSLKCYFGPHQSKGDNLIDFLTDGIMENSAGTQSQTWSSFDSNVILRASDMQGHFEWEETRNYDVVCNDRSGTLPLRLENSTKVEPQQVLAALDRMQFLIRFDGNVEFDFRAWWASHKGQASGGRFSIDSDGSTVNYDGAWLNYSLDRNLTIDKERTPVSIFERS